MIFLLIYIFSVSITWQYFRCDYKKNGITPEYLEVFIVLCPGINTIFVIGKLSEVLWALTKKPLSRINSKKFFKL